MKVTMAQLRVRGSLPLRPCPPDALGHVLLLQSRKATLAKTCVAYRYPFIPVLPFDPALPFEPRVSKKESAHAWLE